MNISYNWLKDLVEVDLKPQEMAEKLTSVGLAVEGIEPHGNDFVFDIDLTSNRGDCLSHLGVARELSAISNASLKLPNMAGLPNSPAKETLVTINEPDLCQRFTARVIRNVKIGPSPEWLVNRLEAIGERSINNVADITNYVMHELGNPMHAFDLNKLNENRIIVRKAKPGETITTLDDVERKISESMLVICDAKKPIAVAGVMGGADSAISDATTDVLLEVAYFKRDSIRQTSRDLKLSTEASHHFERGVDINNLILASNRAAELIIELAGGEAAEFVDLYKTEPEKVEVILRFARIQGLTALEVSNDEVERILTRLGFAIKTQNVDSAVFVVPSWRHDVSIEQDLIEEVARHAGYNNIGEILPPNKLAGEYQPTEPRKKALRTTLANMGFNEAISYSFIDSKNDETFELIPDLANNSLEEKFITLQDSIIEGAVRMRPTLLAGLLDAVRTNFNFQRRDVRLFELGKVFANSASENSLPKEQELFSLILTGNETLEEKAAAGRELDFFDAKGALDAAMDSINVSPLSYSASEIKHLRKGQSAQVLLDGKKIGSIGRINDEIAAGYKFRQPVFVAEIDLQTAFAANEQNIFYRPLPKFPAITRDVSLIVKRQVEFSSLLKTVGELQLELCRNVVFVDIYEGKGMDDDERSLTIRFEYRSDERTLTEAEIEDVHGLVLRKLDEVHGAKQRF